MRRWLARLLDRLAVPGIVRDVAYDASIADVSVKVATGERFTTVSVNGIDVYFARATGRLEGVGHAGGHRWRVVSRAGRLAASPWQ
jgi:hypothetical protein